MSWSAVQTAPYNSTTANVFAISTNSHRRRLEGSYSYEWGINAPEIPPVIAAGSLTGLTGAYNSKYTYARKERQTVVCESNPSPAATTASTLSNQSLLSTAAAPTDEQVNCIRFYRTTAAGATYYYTGEVNYCNRQYSVTYDWEESGAYVSGLPYRFTIEDEELFRECCFLWELVYDAVAVNDYGRCITSIADNVLYLDDNYADSVLGTSVHSDHERPPVNGTYVMGPTANGTLFILKDNRAYYCKPQQPEYWPSLYYVDVSSIQYPLVCGAFYDSQPFLFDRRNIYYMAGTQFADLPNMTTFRPYPQSAQTGALSSAGVCSVAGYGIFHIGLDGVYQFMPGGESGSDNKITGPIDQIFKGQTVNGIPATGTLTAAWLAWYDEKLFFGYPGATDTYPVNVIVFDFSRKKIMYYAYSTAMPAACHDQYYGRLIVAGSAGNLYKLEDRDVTTDIGTAISWEIETKQFVLQTRKHYPRWNKYDVDASSATTCYAYLLLNDTIIQTHTITEARKTRRRLIGIKNGERFAIRFSGSGPVSIYAAESE